MPRRSSSGEAVVGGGDLDRGLHRRDVAEDFDGDPIRSVVSAGQRNLGLDESSSRGDEALDHRRADRFGSKQEPGQTFEADVARPGPVQSGDRVLRVSEVGGDVGGHEKVPTRERVWEVGVVVAALPVAPAHALELRCPSLSNV